VGQVSFPRPPILMIRWNFDYSTWSRFHACVVWILDSYVTQPTNWFLPCWEAYFHRDTHHWPQKEYARKNFRHKKPLSDHMSQLTYCLQIVGMSHLTYCLQIVAENPPTPQQHCQVTGKLQSGLSWWRTSQNNSKNIIFTAEFWPQKNKIGGHLSSPVKWFVRPTQWMIYIPLLVNRFQKSILLIVQYKYWKSCSKDFIPQNLILRTRSCGTAYIT